MVDIIFEAERSIRAKQAGYKKHKTKAASSNFDSGENRQRERFAPARRPWDNSQNPRPN
ncbi:hypothetical protein L484_001817 [Morus notabilis]|uniref:Uncharacterized protein n=1 Tax=Morus notabilis TaxID=981085 RepID=W9RFG1_9ROSA|nr:hypothetical protein L484_001817 [Morus notabilis]